MSDTQPKIMDAVVEISTGQIQSTQETSQRRFTLSYGYEWRRVTVG